jgi:ferredoxin
VVVLALSGITLTVVPDRWVLLGVLDAGVDVLHDCQEGICGSCETKVVEGEVDHRDYVLTEREKAAGDCMMLCVSRACGTRLVLGL